MQEAIPMNRRRAFSISVLRRHWTSKSNVTKTIQSQYVLSYARVMSPGRAGSSSSSMGSALEESQLRAQVVSRKIYSSVAVKALVLLSSRMT